MKLVFQGPRTQGQHTVLLRGAGLSELCALCISKQDKILITPTPEEKLARTNFSVDTDSLKNPRPISSLRQAAECVCTGYIYPDSNSSSVAAAPSALAGARRPAPGVWRK